MTCEGCGTRIVKGTTRRKWCSEKCRKAQHRVPCERCGAPCGGIGTAGGGHGPSRFCVPCGKDFVAERMRLYGDAVRAELSALWCEGLLIREIAQVTESTPGSVGKRVSDYRRRGYTAEFPRRHNVSAAGLRRMSKAAIRARTAERVRKAA